MIICEFGNSIMPNFSICRTRNKQGEDVVTIRVAESCQELDMEQAEYLWEILEEWTTQDIVEEQIPQEMEKVDFKTWDFSSKVNKTGNEVLAVRFLCVYVELNIWQALYLQETLLEWLEEQHKKIKLTQLRKA